MTNLQTKETLLQALREASSRKITSEELRNQRVSFIMGTLADDSGVTRDQVQKVLAEQEGKRVSK